MTRAPVPPDPEAERQDATERTWADDIEDELPPILEALERGGVAALDGETCARALVLAGRARQLSRPGDVLEMLSTRAMPHVAALVAGAPLASPTRLLDRTLAALGGTGSPLDGPLDALLDDDDWLTVHGLAAHARLVLPHDPTEFGDAVGAIVSVNAERVDGLGAFAAARAEGIEGRAHEAPAWEALVDMWSAVLEAPLLMRVASLPAAVQGVTADSLVEGVLSKFPVWANSEEVETTGRQFVGVFNVRQVVTSGAYARGRGLPSVLDPVEIARLGSCRLVLTCGETDDPGAILQIDGCLPDQSVEAERDGQPFSFVPDNFGAEVAEAVVGRYRVTVGEETVEFEIQDQD